MTKKGSGWLLIFYSVPSRPVSNRVRIWRRLAKVGAVHLKGAVSILPFSDENHEFCQWLVSEVTSMGGEGAFVSVEKIETMKDREIIELFNKQRERDYSIIEKGLEELERKINSIRKGTSIQHKKNLSEQFNRYLKEFEGIMKIDFFSSKIGTALKKRIEVLQDEIKGITVDVRKVTYTVTPKRIEDYQSKTWATRKRPFVDRMASAWLIRNFIDKRAVFSFIDEQDMERLDKETITFDMREGEFTHIGDMCTFEVLIKTFGLKNKALKKIAEIVHEIDIKDDRYRNPEADGIEEILIGIRKIIKDDSGALERGISVFEMLYASKT